MAQAFSIIGDIEAGIATATAFIEKRIGAKAEGTPDLIVLRYGLFSVDDARKVGELAYRAPTKGSEKGIVIAAERLFHEAQNALLKVFEEPPAGTTLILVVPSDGIILPTLRSRLTALKNGEGSEGIGEEFVEATPAARAKIVEKLLSRAKSDKPEEKQAARGDALRIAQALMRAAASEREKGNLTLIADLERFLPILHERSAPLKPILEHLVLAVPTRLGRG